MDRIAGVAAPEAALAIPRLEDGFVNMQELLRQLAEGVVNEIMSAEADQLCEATGNSRNGYRDRRLTTCVGVLNLRIPKLRAGSFFPSDVIEGTREQWPCLPAPRTRHISATAYSCSCSSTNASLALFAASPTAVDWRRGRTLLKVSRSPS